MQPPKEVVEQTISMVAQDNMEVACCFIQKTAIEKALMDIDKRMATVGSRSGFPLVKKLIIMPLGV